MIYLIKMQKEPTKCSLIKNAWICHFEPVTVSGSSSDPAKAQPLQGKPPQALIALLHQTTLKIAK